MPRHFNVVSAAVLALGLAGSTLAADAATPTPDIHRQRTHQQERIRQGTRSGRVTPREGMRLHRGQGRVAWMIRRAKADGVITPRERAQIRRMQAMESRHIWRAKHNRRSI